MKKALLLVMLISGIATAKHAHAQTNPKTVFDISEDNFRRRFIVELGRGNRMEVSVTAMSNIAYISNIDSIINMVMKELALTKDTLKSTTTWRKIDYNMDDPGTKKLHIVKNEPTGTYYAIVDGRVAYLKMQQDTLVIHGRIPSDSLHKNKKLTSGYFNRYYFSISFYLNELNDLYRYQDGYLNNKISIIQQHYRDRWEDLADGSAQLKNYPEIRAMMAGGFTTMYQPYRLRKTVDLQNYKDHFIPSLAFTPIYIKEGDFVRKEMGIGVETAFSFERPDGKSTQTHVNVFVAAFYNVLPVSTSRNWVKLYPYIGIAYLVHRSGTVFDKNSFRVALGNFSFGNVSTLIQPALYFNNFLKDITPSIKIVQRF